MKRLDRKSAFGTPRRAVFLKNTCSGLPEALFFSKMFVRDSPKCCFSQKCLFGTPRSVVFLKNACSGVPEALFFSKMFVRESPKRCFSQKQSKYPRYLVRFSQKQSKHPRHLVRFSQKEPKYPRISCVFLKNGRSNPLDGLNN